MAVTEEQKKISTTGIMQALTFAAPAALPADFKNQEFGIGGPAAPAPLASLAIARAAARRADADNGVNTVRYKQRETIQSALALAENAPLLAMATQHRVGRALDVLDQFDRMFHGLPEAGLQRANALGFDSNPEQLQELMDRIQNAKESLAEALIKHQHASQPR